PVREVFRTAAHPYTMGLTNAFPTLEGAQRDLISIPGTPPNLLDPPAGCRFAERCPFAEEKCRLEEPPMHPAGADRLTKCHYPERAEEFRLIAATNEAWEKVGERLAEPMVPAVARREMTSAGNVFEVRGLKRHFAMSGGFFSSLLSNEVT